MAKPDSLYVSLTLTQLTAVSHWYNGDTMKKEARLLWSSILNAKEWHFVFQINGENTPGKTGLVCLDSDTYWSEELLTLQGLPWPLKFFA